MNFELIVKKIAKQLKENDYEFEQAGDQFSFVFSKTCTFWTQHCTIEVQNKNIYVNDQKVNSIAEMLEIINNIEIGLCI